MMKQGKAVPCPARPLLITLEDRERDLVGLSEKKGFEKWSFLWLALWWSPPWLWGSICDQQATAVTWKGAEGRPWSRGHCFPRRKHENLSYWQKKKNVFNSQIHWLPLRALPSFRVGHWPRQFTQGGNHKFSALWRKAPSRLCHDTHASHFFMVFLGGDLGLPCWPLRWVGETRYLCWKVNCCLFTTYKRELDLVFRRHSALALAELILAKTQS